MQPEPFENEKRFAIIDIETTGLRAGQEKITEIAIILHDGKQIIEEFSSLVNPEKKIPHFITQLTGINDQMVSDAPRFYELARNIIELTDNATIVGHNVNFDYSFCSRATTKALLGFNQSDISSACHKRLSGA